MKKTTLLPANIFAIRDHASVQWSCSVIHSCAALMVLFLLIIAPFSAWSQNDGRLRTMTVLPDIDVTVSRTGSVTTDLQLYASKEKNKTKRDRLVYMHFALGLIPKDAKIDSVSLVLYLKEQGDPDEVQTVKIYELPKPALNWNTINWKDQPVKDGDITGYRSVAVAEAGHRDINKGVYFSMDVLNPNSWLTEKNNNLWFAIAANAQEFTYHSSRTNVYAWQPKLVVVYHMPDQLQLSDWAQYKNNAQHTGQLNWQSNTFSTDFKIHTILDAGTGYIQSDPVLCNGLLVFSFQEYKGAMNRTRAYTTNGTLVAENTTSDSLVKYGPVADRKGNIYCFTKGGASMQILSLDSNLKIIFNRQLADNASLVAMPVVGFDGSLYLSTNKGVYAYTAYPEFKVKWKYSSSQNFWGSVTLSEDEKTAYVYDGNRTNDAGTGRLIAIDNVEDTIRWQNTGLPGFSQDVPVPAVRNGYLCLTDGYSKGKNFYVFNAKTGTKKIQVPGNGGVSDLISQPVMDTDQVFIINTGKLQSYKLSSLALKEFNIPGELNPASSLAMDKNKNVYILSPEYKNQSMTVVSAFNSHSFRLDINENRGNLKDNLLLLAPDGQLISGNARYLYAFRPQGFNEKNKLTIPLSGDQALSGEYLYRSEDTITVSGRTITANKNVIIHSGKGVGFQKEFNVQKGAQLSIKTGY